MLEVRPATSDEDLTELVRVVTTVRWAAEHGLEALDGANDIENAPMRAVNQRLGYRPQPDEVMFRGPLAAAPAPAR